MRVAFILALILLVSNLNIAKADTTITPVVPTDQQDDAYPGEEIDIKDPYESVNRVIFKLNKVLDKGVLKPIAKLYEVLIPQWGRDRVNAFLYNLQEPVHIINYAIQGDKDNFNQSFGRFLTNTTGGLAGLFDIASEQEELWRNPTDFGLTLKSYGFKTGPYIVLPILGPSNLRDAPGKGIDMIIDPKNYILKGRPRLILYALDAIDTRQRFDEVLTNIEKTSLDEYVAIRSMYMQKRQ